MDRLLQDSRVSQIPLTKSLTVGKNASFRDVLRQMRLNKTGSACIQEAGKLCGIFTERDLLSKVLAKGQSLNINVSEVASSPLITTPAGNSIHNVAAAMAMKHIKRMPVTAEDQALVGVITARDLVEAYAR